MKQKRSAVASCAAHFRLSSLAVAALTLPCAAANVVVSPGFDYTNVVIGVYAVYSVLLELANERGVPPLTAVCRAFGWSLAALAPLVAWKSVQSCAQGQGGLAAVVLDAAANAARCGKLANLLNVVFLGLVASAASFVLWSAACRDLGVVRVTAALYLTPIAGVVFAAVFLGEKVTGLEILGGAAILVGVAIATLAPGGVCNKANGVRSEI